MCPQQCVLVYQGLDVLCSCQAGGAANKSQLLFRGAGKYLLIVYEGL